MTPDPGIQFPQHRRGLAKAKVTPPASQKRRRRFTRWARSRLRQVGGNTDQWRPALFEGTKPIEPYVGKPNYSLDVDLAGHAIDWTRMQKSGAPQKPFLAYYATGSAHAPHHPPQDWNAQFKGKFDQG